MHKLKILQWTITQVLLKYIFNYSGNYVLIAAFCEVFEKQYFT